MAFAAARAAVNARIKRKKLLAKAQAQTRIELDESERRGLIDELKHNDCTDYLAKLIDGTSTFSVF